MQRDAETTNWVTGEERVFRLDGYWWSMERSLWAEKKKRNDDHSPVSCDWYASGEDIPQIRNLVKSRLLDDVGSGGFR